jgi:hypothetical protein
VARSDEEYSMLDSMEESRIYDRAEWSTLISSMFEGMKVSNAAPGFRAAGHLLNLGDVQLLNISTDPHAVEWMRASDGHRDSATEAGATMCNLSLQIDAMSRVVQDGRTCELRPGGLALYTDSRGYRIDFTVPQRSLIVFFPRSYIHLRDDEIDRVTATAVSDSAGLGKVAVPLFRHMAENLDELRGLQGMALVRSSLDVVTTVLSGDSQRAGSSGVAASDIFLSALDVIDENLDDP